MKIQAIAATIAVSVTAATAFVISPSNRLSTKLHISSWGKNGPPSRWKDKEAAEQDPERKIQSYLKPPEPIAGRSNLDGTVLVSGWVNNKERTDETIFNFLNEEESAFQFEKIIAFVDDEKFAKKRLISRTARYTGLLNKLAFVQAESEGSLPTGEQLKESNVKSWVVNAGDDLSTVAKVADLVKESGCVENVSILITDAQKIEDANAAMESVKTLEAVDCKFTIVAVGAIAETPEGQSPYGIAEFGTTEGMLNATATYSRDESLRVLAETLGLASGENKAMVFTEIKDVNATEWKLVKGLREGGYTRPQEIDHMIVKGPAAYAQAIEDYKVRVPSATPQDEWLAMKQLELDESAADRKNRIKEEYEQKKTDEIEQIAREWAKREYFRKATSGDMPYSEEEYIKSVWERALFEGDLKYRMLHGQETDERKELAEFKVKQEKKKAMMLERAQASLNEALDEEDDLVKSGKDEE
jgi:hypothetical protein